MLLDYLICAYILFVYQLIVTSMSSPIPSQDPEADTLPEDFDQIEQEATQEQDLFSFDNVIKQLGEINMALYGVNPYKKV